ncbi:MAG: pectate lyase precursor [Kiritimatiellae bacterium]|nr:pectate lyase precursor [Kiritimatiellia bacterium]
MSEWIGVNVAVNPSRPGVPPGHGRPGRPPCSDTRRGVYIDRNAATVVWLSVALMLLAAAAAWALPAFPGAEGFGAVSRGGRGGQVIKVTNLNTSGPGSLQAACDVSGPRMVVFDVSGVIHGDVTIRHPSITIAGQTAPGAGITVEGRLIGYGYNLHDVTVRFLRFRRLRPPPAQYSQGDCATMGQSSNGIMDHCSFSWGTDEVVDIYQAHDWTVQWCTIEESDPIDSHNFGFICRASNSGNVSVHHNLFAHHYRRAPCLSPDRLDWPGDVRNNVIYDVYQCFVHDGERTGIVNIVGNYYIYGPSHARIFMIAAYADGTYHIAGNYLAHYQGRDYGPFGDLSGGESFPSWVQYNYLGTKLASPVSVPPVTTHSATQAYDIVLAEAGCFPRDRVTRRTIEEVRTGTGSCDRNAPLTPTDAWYLDGLTPCAPPQDTDNDGMPDTWEEANGLNKQLGTDPSRLMPSGYTAIEEYVNGLAAQRLHGLVDATPPAPPGGLRLAAGD